MSRAANRKGRGGVTRAVSLGPTALKRVPIISNVTYIYKNEIEQSRSADLNHFTVASRSLREK